MACLPSAQAGVSEPTCLQQAGVLQLAEAVSGDGGGGGAGVPGAEAGERTPEEAVGRPRAGDRRDEDGDAKKTVTPQARRNYVQVMVELQVSERRSCQLAGMSRSGYRYRRIVREGDEQLKADLRVIAGENPAAGYRTAWALLRREGREVNHKRVQRLWREAGLTQPRKRKRRRRTGESVPVKATHANDVWTYDFIHDRTVGGGALRMLTVEDEYTREGLAVPACRQAGRWAARCPQAR